MIGWLATGACEIWKELAVPLHAWAFDNAMYVLTALSLWWVSIFGGALAAEKAFNEQFHRIGMAKIGLSPEGIPAINQDRQPENYLFTWQIFAP